MAMCLSSPQPAMICCHSAIERPYFFSMDGKYEAGPCFGHGGAFSVIVMCFPYDMVRDNDRGTVVT
jgi:hypothetical protein